MKKIITLSLIILGAIGIFIISKPHKTVSSLNNLVRENIFGKNLQITQDKDSFIISSVVEDVKVNEEEISKLLSEIYGKKQNLNISAVILVVNVNNKAKRIIVGKNVAKEQSNSFWKNSDYMDKLSWIKNRCTRPPASGDISDLCEYSLN